MTFDNPWLDMEKRRSEVNRHGENTPRLAQAWATWRTQGWGETAFPKCHNFDLTFAERPFVSYSNVILRNSLDASTYDVDDVLVDTRFPRCFGGVYQWRQTSRGFYTGAWCYVVVETASAFVAALYPEPGYTIQHHFTFSGIGIKELPEYDLDDPADTAKPRDTA